MIFFSGQDHLLFFLFVYISNTLSHLSCHLLLPTGGAVSSSFRSDTHWDYHLQDDV